MLDPLSVNIEGAGVETGIALLPEADYTVQVAESSIDPNKDKTGLNWNLKLVTTSPTVAVDGREVAPNFPVFTTYALQPRDDSKDTEAFKRQLFQVVDALFGTDKTNRPAFSKELADAAVGKMVIAHVFIEEWKGDKKNKVKRLKPVTA